MCAVTGVAASAALAGQRPQPDPSELWRSYPLEQKPATVAKSPTSGRTQQRPTGGSANGRAPATAANRSSGPSPTLIVILVAAAGLVALAAVTVRRRRQRPAAAGPVFSPEPPRAAPVAAATAQRALGPPAAPGAPAAARPRTRRRTTPVRESMICQVRWNRRGRSFYAVSVDSNGIEHMLASSPRLDEAGPAPPEETPEARAAIRQLAKDLRDRGWRPLRAKGIDFEERRWYARRFRWPTDEEVAKAGEPDAAEIDERMSGRSVGGR